MAHKYIRFIFIVSIFLISFLVNDYIYAQNIEESLKKASNYCVGGGKYDESIVEFTRIIKNNPELTLAFFGRGLAYYFKNNTVTLLLIMI